MELLTTLAHEERVREPVGDVDDPDAAVQIEDPVVVGVDRRLDVVLAACVAGQSPVVGEGVGRTDGRAEELRRLPAPLGGTGQREIRVMATVWFSGSPAPYRKSKRGRAPVCSMYGRSETIQLTARSRPASLETGPLVS